MIEYLFRPWQGSEDTRAIYELAALLPDEALGAGAAALPYQLSSWAIDDPNNLALWTTAGGDLMAFALFQIPFAALAYGVHPGAPLGVLEDAIFAWSKERAATLAKSSSQAATFQTWATESHTDIQALLAAQGFARQESYRLFFHRPLTAPIPTPQLPPDFTVRPLAGLEEVEAATILLCEAFNINSVTVPWRRRILEQPSYRPELDIVIVAPDGRLASFCLLWLHPQGHSVQIEPMATHPDFQRLGLGRAAIYAGLTRAAALGATRAVVATGSSNLRSQGMYQSAGFLPNYKRIGYQYSVPSL